MASAPPAKPQTAKPKTPQNLYTSNSAASGNASTSQPAPEEKKQLGDGDDGDGDASVRSKSVHSQVFQGKNPSGPKQSIKWGVENLDLTEELEWGEKANGERNGLSTAREWGVDNDEAEEGGFRLGTDLTPEDPVEENSRGDDTKAFYDYVQDAKKIIENFLTDELPSLTPAPPSTSELEASYYQCQYCLRRFTEKFALTHFEACSKSVDNKKKICSSTELLRSNSQATTSRSRSRYYI